MTPALRVFLAISGASVAGAVLWLVMRWPPGNLGHIAGAAMILSGAVVAISPLARVAGPGRALGGALGACIIGGASEIAGLYWQTFGAYAYTRAWKPSIELPNGFAFPVFLPIIWSVILCTCYSFTRQRLNVVPAVVAGAALAAALDLVAEPMLTGPVGFWVWLEPTPLFGAPYSNALGWFLTSLAGCSCIALASAGKRPTGSEPTWIIISALAGNVIVGTTHGEPRSLAALLLLVPLAFWRPRTVT